MVAPNKLALLALLTVPVLTLNGCRHGYGCGMHSVAGYAHEPATIITLVKSRETGEWYANRGREVEGHFELPMPSCAEYRDYIFWSRVVKEDVMFVITTAEGTTVRTIKYDFDPEATLGEIGIKPDSSMPGQQNLAGPRSP